MPKNKVMLARLKAETIISLWSYDRLAGQTSGSTPVWSPLSSRMGFRGFFGDGDGDGDVGGRGEVL